ncbi:hypothetical protein [Vibrio phage vB_VpS_PG28]|nr:hypothetical protein [Vibrio phage vB_VpS_PG28]
MSKKKKIKAVIKDRYPEQVGEGKTKSLLIKTTDKLSNALKEAGSSIYKFKEVWGGEHKGKVFAPENITVTDITARQVEYIVTRVLNDTDVHKGKKVDGHKSTVSEMVPILYGNWQGDKDKEVTKNEEFYQYFKKIVTTYIHGLDNPSIGVDYAKGKDHTDSYLSVNTPNGAALSKSPSDQGVITVLEHLHSQIDQNLEGLAPTGWHQVLMDSLRSGALPVPIGGYGEYWGVNGWTMYVKGLNSQQVLQDMLERDLQRKTFMFKKHRICVPDMISYMYHGEYTAQDAYAVLVQAWHNLYAMYNVLPKKGISMKQTLILAWEMILVQAFWNGGNVLLPQIRMLAEPLYQFLNMHTWELPSEVDTDMIKFIQKIVDSTLPISKNKWDETMSTDTLYIEEAHKQGGVVISKGKHYWERLSSPYQILNAYTPTKDLYPNAYTGQNQHKQTVKTHTVYCNSNTPFAWTLDKVH